MDRVSGCVDASCGRRTGAIAHRFLWPQSRRAGLCPLQFGDCSGRLGQYLPLLHLRRLAASGTEPQPDHWSHYGYAYGPRAIHRHSNFHALRAGCDSPTVHPGAKWHSHRVCDVYVHDYCGPRFIGRADFSVDPLHDDGRPGGPRLPAPAAEARLNAASGAAGRRAAAGTSPW